MRQLWMVAFLIVVATVGATKAEPAPKRVLLLHSLGPNLAPWSSISGRFREGLIRESSNEIELYEASLLSARVGISDDLVDYLRSQFPRGDPDLMVAMGTPAVRFILRHRSEMFPSTPLL